MLECPKEHCLKHVLFCPRLPLNLSFLRQLVSDLQCKVTLNLDSCVFKRLLVAAIRKEVPTICQKPLELQHSPIWSLLTLNPMGYPTSKLHGILPHISALETFYCKAWHKCSRFPVSHSPSSQSLLYLLHVDLWGPSWVLCRSCFRYFFIIVDFSRVSCVFWGIRQSPFVLSKNILLK